MNGVLLNLQVLRNLRSIHRLYYNGWVDELAVHGDTLYKVVLYQFG